MNIVIIGCNGFIGSNFLNYYSSIGADILCVGRIKPKSFQHKFLELDDFLSLDKKLEYDIWINAAGSGDVQLSLTKPEIDYNANVELVRLLLELKLKISPTGIFVHFSSAAVYGNPIKLPIAENDELNPITPYGEHKLLSEQICRKYANDFGLKTIVFRPFSIFGIGQTKLILWDVFQKYNQGDKPILLFGNGKESRDFLHIHDLIQLVIVAVNHSLKNNIYFDVYNAASGLETEINSVTNIIKPILSNSQFEFTGNVRVGDPRNWKANIKKANQIGFYPKVKLENGIIEYYNWLLDA